MEYIIVSKHTQFTSYHNKKFTSFNEADEYLVNELIKEDEVNHLKVIDDYFIIEEKFIL